LQRASPTGEAWRRGSDRGMRQCDPQHVILLGDWRPQGEPGGSGFATLARRAGSAFPAVDRIHDGSPSNDFSVSIACARGMRLHALDRTVLGFALDGRRPLEENRAGSHEEMTCELFPFDCLRWISFGASSPLAGA
jgi:hypothetical protein